MTSSEKEHGTANPVEVVQGGSGTSESKTQCNCSGYYKCYGKRTVLQLQQDRASGVTLQVLALNVKHLHCISISIITFIHEHHAMVMYHFMLSMCGKIA